MTKHLLHYSKLLLAIIIVSSSIKSNCQTIDNDFFEKVQKLEVTSPKVDSIASILLDYEKVDTNFVKTVINIAVKYRQSKRYTEGAAFIDKMLSNETLIADPLVYGKLYDNKAGMYMYRGEDSLSIDAFSHAIQGFTKAKDTLRLTWMYGNLSAIHSSRGNLQTALDSLKKLEPLILSSPSAEKKYGWSFYAGLRFVYYRMKNNNAALQYSKKMISITKYPSDLWLRSAYNLADDYIAMENDSADIFIDSMLNVPNLDKLPEHYDYVVGMKIRRAINTEKDIRLAEDLLLRLQTYCNNNVCALKKHEILNYKAQIAELKGLHTKAAQYYINAYNSYQNHTVNDPYYSNELIHKYFANNFSSNKDYNSVALLDTLEKNYTKLREDITKQEVEAYRVEFETSKKEMENKNLIVQQQLDKSVIERQSTMLTLGLSALGLFVLFTSVLLRQRKKLKKLNQDLSTQKRQIQTLNQELNHRVKNNLAFMTSLMEMQGRRVENVEAKHILRESESRLKTLSIVHSKLFQNELDTKIDLKRYLNEITTHLQKVFTIQDKDLQLKTSFDSIMIEAEEAVRIGLILNELFTNSVKHAFKNVANPTIAIRTNTTNDGKIKLSFEDNGPKEFNKEINSSKVDSNGSIGLKLIQLLRKQLDHRLILQV